jgi:hypothetical protein
MSTSYNQLKKLNLISWPTLFVGFETHWISKQDIEDYAVSLLEKSADLEINIALLACANDYDVFEIRHMLKKQFDSKNLIIEVEMDKLRLAALSSLKESTLSEEEKCDKLQELYAIFNYPDDMSMCSIYSANTQYSPLEAMHELILFLKHKYQVM